MPSRVPSIDSNNTTLRYLGYKLLVIRVAFVVFAVNSSNRVSCDARSQSYRTAVNIYISMAVLSMHTATRTFLEYSTNSLLNCCILSIQQHTCRVIQAGTTGYNTSKPLEIWRA